MLRLATVPVRGSVGLSTVKRRIVGVEFGSLPVALVARQSGKVVNWSARIPML